MAGFVEFSARSTEEALRLAEKHFALPIAQLDVEILSMGSGGLLGLFAKKARIRAQKNEASSVQEEVARILGNNRNKLSASSRPVAPVAAPAKAVASEDTAGSAPGGYDAPDIDETAMLEHAGQVLEKLCRPLVGQFTLNVSFDRQNMHAVINCQDPGSLIGRRAQTLNALQYLAARIISHHWGRAINLALDVADYRARRQIQLEQAALKLAQKVEKQGRPFALGPLSTAERRIVHNVLKGKALQTFSKGQGEFKRVVIAPMNRAREEMRSNAYSM